MYLFTNEEIGLLEWFSKKIDYVSTEEVLSGRGLVNIYNYLCFKENHTSEMSTADQIGLAAKEGNILTEMLLGLWSKFL